jgi:hypothetical protein
MKRRRLRTRENVVTHSRKLTIIPLIFSVIFLITGTYAWFTYFSDVDVNLTGHVVSWKINFDDDSGTTETTMEFNKIYPGMDDEETAATLNKFLSIENQGETSAEVTYYIKSIDILGETYNLGDYMETPVTASTFAGLLGDIYTYDETNDVYTAVPSSASYDSTETYYSMLDATNMADILNTKYPFKFNFGFVSTANDTTSTAVQSAIIPKFGVTGNNTNFRANISWPYETYIKVENSDVFNDYLDYYTKSGDTYTKANVTASNFDTLKSTLYYANDIEDTYWGNKAAEYYQEQSGHYAAEDIISVKLTVVVHAEEHLGS